MAVQGAEVVYGSGRYSADLEYKASGACRDLEVADGEENEE